MCPDPNCRVSSLNAGKFEERKRRSGSGNVDLKRNKNDNYLNFLSTTSTPSSYTSHTLNNPISEILNDTPRIMSITRNNQDKFIALNMSVNDVSISGTIDSGAQLFAELENETRRESKLKPPYLQKTDQFSCLNFALEWHRYSRARGKSIDISQHLLELENQVLAWRQLAEPTTADELFTPFEDVLSINKTTYGEPRHGLDLARDLLLNVDIRGIQLHVDPHILSSWKSDGTIANFLCNWAIWERIILSSQFESPQIADNALAECRMDWDKSWSSNKERWDDFLRRFTIVANMSTMIELNTTQLYCFEARDILKYFAHNIGIRIIRSDTKIFFKDKASFAQLSTVEVFKDLKDRYLNWCSQNIQRQNVRPQYISDARFLDTTRPSTPPNH
ncbi:hypothetical protein GEMRC1_002210 [Eukaryota sp. GEM-RC1]